MKALVLILSVYMLGLNFIPCDDLDANIENENLLVLQDKAHPQNHDHSENKDLCSPFCQCHCCHIHILEFELTEISIFNPLIISEETSYHDLLGIEVNQALLQPPQV